MEGVRRKADSYSDPSVRKACGFPAANLPFRSLFAILSVRLCLTNGEAKPRAVYLNTVPESQRLSARKAAEPLNRQLGPESFRAEGGKAARIELAKVLRKSHSSQNVETPGRNSFKVAAKEGTVSPWFQSQTLGSN